MMSLEETDTLKEVDEIEEEENGIAPISLEDSMESLKANQQKAIKFLIDEQFTDQEVADRIGVRRETVNRWRNHDDDFKRVLQHRISQIEKQTQDRIAALAEGATSKLKEAIEYIDPGDEDSFGKLLKFLKETGALGSMKRNGSGDEDSDKGIKVNQFFSGTPTSSEIKEMKEFSGLIRQLSRTQKDEVKNLIKAVLNDDKEIEVLVEDK